MASLDGRDGSAYDVVVVGSGAAGLTCATRLAQAGARVLLAEKNTWLGGYSRGFSQNGFYWDHGGHIFLAYRLGGQARQVFQRLRLDERVEMLPDKHEYSCVFPDESLAVPAELTEAGDVFARRFPEERDGIFRVLLTMERLIDQVDRFVPSFRVTSIGDSRRVFDPILEQFQRPSVANVASRIAGQLPLPGRDLLRYQRRTLTDLLNEHLKSQRLKGYFSMLSAGIGAAPSELSAVIAGVFFVHALRTMWMPQGGFGKLAEALAELFQESGGTVLTSAEVIRIVVQGGRVVGVETRDGRLFGAPYVISACDARRTFVDMLPRGHVSDEFRDRLSRMDLTPSIFQVQLGVDMDLQPYRAHLKRLNFMYPSDDIDRSMANFANGNVEEAAFFLYVASFHQPEMAPPRQHSLKLEAYTRLDSRGIDWERDKQRIGDVFIRRAERLIPNLSKHIVARAHRTPADLYNDTANAEGAFAGWAFTPDLLSRARPAQRTSVPGLYLAGHWTAPTAGVPWVMLSGFNTANLVLADRARLRRVREHRAPAASPPAGATRPTPVPPAPSQQLRP